MAQLVWTIRTYADGLRAGIRDALTFSHLKNETNPRANPCWHFFIEETPRTARVRARTRTRVCWQQPQLPSHILHHILHLWQALLRFHAAAAVTELNKRVGKKGGSWEESGGMEEGIVNFATETGRTATKAQASPIFWFS